MRNVDRWEPSKIIYAEGLGRYVPHPRVRAASQLAVATMAEPYVRVIQQHATGRLLDCGCGRVPYYEVYRDLVEETVCIDWSQSAHGTVHLDQEVDLNGPLPFTAARFDTVLLADVLEHIPEPARLLEEIARVLAPNGKLIGMVPFLYWVHEAPHDYHRYTTHALERLTRNAGLEPLEIRAYGGYPDVLLDLVNKGLAGWGPLCRAFVAFGAKLQRMPRYDRWRARSTDAFPLGYCFVAQKAGTT